MYQNAKTTINSGSSTDGLKPAFNYFALGFSAFLFLATFSYWFVDINSPASLINLVIVKTALLKDIADSAYSHTWVPYYLHLFVTTLGLLIYFNSGFTKWIGGAFSQQYYIQNCFHADHKTATKIIQGIRILFAALLIFNIYGLIMGMVAGESLPTGSAKLTILFFFLLTAVWNISRIEAIEYPGYSGVLNSKSKRLWFRLSAKQFAYVQDLESLNSWKLYKDNAYIDLSFTECYIFFPDNFNIIITDSMLSKDLVGSIRYSVRSDINTKYLPESLTTAELINLNTKFTTNAEFDRLVYVLLDDDGLITQAKDNMFNAAQEYFNIDQNIFINNTLKNRDDLRKILNSRTDFRPIERKIEGLVTDEATELIGTQKLLKISFKITDAQFKMDDLLKEVLDSQRKTTDTVKNSNLTTQTTILTAAVETIKIPGHSKNSLNNLLGFADKISKSFSSNQNSTALPQEREIEEKLMQDPLKIASGNMVSAMLAIMDNDPTPESMAEAVSKSTPFISDNDISVTTFIQTFFTKLGTERKDRSFDAYQQLAEDALMELMERKG